MFFFSPQEYQHVHLLWFKKRSFILVWKPNPPLRSVRCANLHARADAASINHSLALNAPLFTWSVKSDSCYNVPRLCSARCMKQTLWSSADHALAQVRPRQIFTCTFSKNGRSLEPCICWANGKRLQSQRRPHGRNSPARWGPVGP